MVLNTNKDGNARNVEENKMSLLRIGTFLISAVIAFVIYRVYVKFVQYTDTILNREMKYEIVEEIYLDEIAQKKGIDLNKELIKRKIIDTIRPKSLRKKIKDEIFNDLIKNTAEIREVDRQRYHDNEKRMRR